MTNSWSQKRKPAGRVRVPRNALQSGKRVYDFCRPYGADGILYSTTRWPVPDSLGAMVCRGVPALRANSIEAHVRGLRNLG